MGEEFFQTPIEEVIKARYSVRTYKPEVLSKELINKLKEYAKGVNGPFDPRVRFEFVNRALFVEKTGSKIGTYGVIKGANNFIAAIVEKNKKMNLEEVGYCFEKLILYATFLGLGTCWLGGTFRRKGFDSVLNMSEDEMLPVITPVGYPDKKKSLTDKFMKAAVGSKKRKPWSNLFFDKSFEYPLDEKEVGSYAIPLEMVRLAPSASNLQPWRIVRDNNHWHFFMNYSQMVNKTIGFDIQKIDMGIAMCHFEMTAKEKGLSGQWLIKEEKPRIYGAAKPHYIVSWHAKFQS